MHGMFVVVDLRPK